MELTNEPKRDARGMGSHQQTIGKEQDWITPQALIEKAGPFDLDPCASMTQPWPCAKRSYTKLDDGLTREWEGRVFLNPPYDTRVIGHWLAKLAAHGNGVALIFARTETQWFHEQVWRRATGIYFFEGRINFYTPRGIRAKYNSGAPSCLVAYGYGAAQQVRMLTVVARESWPGVYVELR